MTQGALRLILLRCGRQLHCKYPRQSEQSKPHRGPEVSCCPWRLARVPDCPTPSMTRHNSGPLGTPGVVSARTRCGLTARRCDNTCSGVVRLTYATEYWRLGLPGGYVRGLHVRAGRPGRAGACRGLCILAGVRCSQPVADRVRRALATSPQHNHRCMRSRGPPPATRGRTV